MSGRLRTGIHQEVSLLGANLNKRTLAASLLLLLTYALVLQRPSTGRLDVGAGLEAPRTTSFSHLVGGTGGERVGLSPDLAFLEGFYSEESGQNYSFRWSEPTAHIRIGGLAPSALLLRIRMHGAADGTATITRLEAGGQLLAEFPVPYPLHEYTLILDPTDWSGDTLQLDLHSTALIPGGEDTRKLGVAVDRLSWAGLGTDWRPSLPPTALFLAGTALLLYLGLRRAGLPAPWAETGTLLWGGATLAGLLAPSLRSFVALYSRGLLGAAALAYPVLVVTLRTAGALLRRSGCSPSRHDWNWLGVLFFLCFLLAFGGTMSPRYAGHDAGFHAHRIEFIERGALFFEHVSLEAGLRSDPYPGTLYLLLAPLAGLLQHREGLLAFFLAWAKSSEILLIWFLARQLSGPRASRWAALLYLGFPIGLSAYWFAIYANLFAIWLSLLVLAALVLALQGRISTAWPYWLPLFTLVFLSHFGNTILWSLLCPLWGLLLYGQGGPLQRIRLRRLALAWLLALVLSVLLYYSAYLPFFQSMLQASISTRPQPLGEDGQDWLPRALAELRVWWRWGAIADYAGIGLPLAGLGLGLPHPPRARHTVLLLWAIVAVSLFFWAVSMASFFFVRYMLFLLPAAALGTARLLTLCWQKGTAGRVLVILLLAYICGMTLWMWLGLCLFGLRPVHVL